MFESSVVSTAVTKASEHDSREFSTSVMNKYQEGLRKKTTSKDTQGQKSDCDEIPIGLEYLSFQQDIDLIEKYDIKNQ